MFHIFFSEDKHKSFSTGSICCLACLLDERVLFVLRLQLFRHTGPEPSISLSGSTVDKKRLSSDLGSCSDRTSLSYIIPESRGVRYHDDVSA